MKSKLIKTKLKLNDNVVIISGSDKGRRGKILAIDKKGGRLIVEGINKRQKFVKATQENPKGGVMNLEFPLKISKVQYFCDKCKQGVRLKIDVTSKGKDRVCKKCGKSLG